jgi:uncharacterized protein YxjI
MTGTDQTQDLSHAEPLGPFYEPAGPTETNDWLRCPTYWMLNKTWQQTGNWKPHLALGAAIGVGLNHLLQQTPDRAEIEALDVLGARFEPSDEWTLEALQGLTVKAIREAAKTTVKDMLETEKVLQCELTIGKGRIDLVSKRQNTLIVTDHKVSLQMKSEYILKNLREAETDWQLWDYAYRAREYYQTNDIIVRRHLGVLTPRTKWFTHEVVIKPEVLDRWVRGAQEIWNQIARARQTFEIEGPDSLPMNLRECNGRFGRCPFFDACHSCNLDPTAMSVLYTEKEK